MNIIKGILKQSSKYQKEDYLENLIEQGLNNKERKEIVPIILDYFSSHNDWILVLLIDLSASEQIVSEKLINRYCTSLLAGKSYYIQLSILDYINITKELYKENKIVINDDIIEQLAYDKKSRLIVRNQALLYLINIFPLKKMDLLLQLKKNLKRTNDYRAHIRLYTTLLDNSFYKEILKEDIYCFFEISMSMNLGKAVELKIEELHLLLKEMVE